MSGATVRLRAVPRLATLLAALGLAACQGSDPQPLELLSLDRFGSAESLVDGGGASSVVGYTSVPASGPPALRLVRHEATDPDRVSLLGEVSFAPGGRISRLRVTDEAAALVVGGTVWVVDPADPALPTEQLLVPGSAVDVAVNGRWVAVAVSHGLFLLHRDAPGTTFLQVASSTPTALLATSGGFLAFTTTGFLVADVFRATPAFAEVGDPVLRNVAFAAAAGGEAILAGPGAAPDRTRLLRVDLSDPAAPAVLRSLELPGAFVAGAWDGADATVLAVHGEGDDATPTSFHQGFLLRDGAQGFGQAGLPLPFWSQSTQPLAAHAGRLFAVQGGGLALLRVR